MDSVEIGSYGRVIQVATGSEKLMFAITFPTTTAETLFDYWTKPELITQWWPQQAEIDARQGGEYHLSWPGMEWHLRGRYDTLKRGSRLAFTWNWDHEPARPTRHVEVSLEPLLDGTVLILTQGHYLPDSEDDQQERQGHIDGWLHFLRKLQELLGG